MPNNDIRKMYQDSLTLAKDSQKLTDELAKYNPGIAANGRKSFTSLAADAGALIYHGANLRAQLTNAREKV